MLIMVNHLSSTIRLSTGLDISKKEFERKTSADYRQALMMLGKVQILLDNLMLEGRLGDTSPKQLGVMIRATLGLKAAATQADLLETCFTSFAERKAAQRTKEIYLTTLSKIGRFANLKRLTIHQITADWVEDFEVWMRKEGLATNTRAIHLRNVRAVVHDLYKKGVLKDYPFKAISIKREETRHRALTIEQLRKLKDAVIDDPKKRLYRDLFMLDFYLIGISRIDLLTATHDQVINGRLEYRRRKTGRLYSIRLEPEALEIIKRYKGEKNLLFVLEKYKSMHDFCRRWVEGLASLGTGSSQGKRGKKPPLLPSGVTPYWSRHTWATIAFNDCDISKDAVSLALGHSFGVAVTDIYINYTNKIIDAANRAVIDALNGRKC